MDIPSARFRVIHVDLVGPFEISQGSRYLLTVIDRFSRWPEAFPISDITAETCARTLLSGWVARFGLPDTIISDRGAQFTSSLWERLSHFLGFQIHHTSAYHPQANGMVERLHRQLKESFWARQAGCDWARQLPWILLGIRTAPKDDSGYSPVQLVFGTSLRVPGVMCDILDISKSPSQVFQDVNEAVKSYVPLPTTFHGQASSFVPTSLHSCSHVWLRVDRIQSTLSSPYEGPFKVLKRNSKNMVLLINEHPKTVNIDTVKPAFMVEKPIQTTRSGRLVKRVDRFQVG